jgi:hypothetical protein
MGWTDFDEIWDRICVTKKEEEGGGEGEGGEEEERVGGRRKIEKGGIEWCIVNFENHTTLAQ